MLHCLRAGRERTSARDACPPRSAVRLDEEALLLTPHRAGTEPDDQRRHRNGRPKGASAKARWLGLPKRDEDAETRPREQLPLVRRGAHLQEQLRAKDVFLDRRLDPPHGVGCQAGSYVRVEAPDRLHQSDFVLGHDFAGRQAEAVRAHGGHGHEAKVRRHKPMGGLAVTLVASELGGEELLRRLRHRKPMDPATVAGRGGIRNSGAMDLPVFCRMKTPMSLPKEAASVGAGLMPAVAVRWSLQPDRTRTAPSEPPRRVRSSLGPALADGSPGAGV